MMAAALMRHRASSPALLQLLQRRALSSGEQKVTAGGFSYPAPRALQQIVRLELLEREPRENIAQIWADFHRDKDDALVTTLRNAAFASLAERARAAPFFIFPVYRGEGFFNMLCQFQDTCFLLTALEAFKENPALAPPCLTVSLYGDLAESKDIGLVRADIVNLLDKQESQVLLDQVLASYSDEKLFAWVHKFNHEPDKFDFEAYRLEMQSFTEKLPSSPASE